jgi:tetratricopeptide (TPR) repeat protein
MAKALFDQGRSAEGEPLLREAITMYRRLEGEDSLLVSRALVNLGRVLMHDRSKRDEGLQVLEGALAINRRQFDGKHADMVQSLSALANALAIAQEDTAAEARYLEAIELGREVFGPDHPDVVTPQANLAIMYTRTNRLTEAEVLMSQVHEAELHIFGPDSPRHISHEQSLAELRELMGDLPGAEAHYRSALALASRINAMADTPACIARSGLAILLVDDGRNDEAEVLLEEQLQIADADSILTKWCVFHAQSLLGEIRMTQGRLAEAEHLLEEGADGLRTTPLAGARRRRRAIEQLARCYDQLNMASPGAGFDVKAAVCREQLAP